MEGKFFKGAAMYDENADMPTPDDPEMVDLMVRRGQRVFLLIFVLAVVLMPLGILGIGYASLQYSGSPICGRFAEREVLDGGECGENLSWEFFIGVGCLGLVFALMCCFVPSLFLAAPRCVRFRRRARPAPARRTDGALTSSVRVARTGSGARGRRGAKRPSEGGAARGEPSPGRGACRWLVKEGIESASHARGNDDARLILRRPAAAGAGPFPNGRGDGGRGPPVIGRRARAGGHM